MIFWAVFTCGFIVGGVFASFIFGQRESNMEEPLAVYPKFPANDVNITPDKIFDRLIQINYPTANNQERITTQESIISPKDQVVTLNS